MSRWANADLYRPLIEAAAIRNGVPTVLVAGLIARESGFDPRAYLAEVGGDGSVGLMQIRPSTAKGVGYTGPLGYANTLTGLYDPATNIEYGTKYLAQQYRKSGSDLAGAASAYNGGWRPEIGFGRPVTKQTTVCLRRDPISGDCIKTRIVPPGEYANQDHVNAVVQYTQQFDAEWRKPVDIPLPAPSTPSPTGGGVNTNTAVVAALVGSGLAFLLWRLLR